MNPHPNPHRTTLDQTIEAGANIIRLLNAQAEAEAQSPTPTTANNLATLAAAFARAHRALRLGILLAQKLEAAPQATPATDRTAARTRILRAVEDQIGDKAEHAEAPKLHAELRERLDTPEFEADLRSRTPEDLITEITRDLGLQSIYGTAYKRRTPADLALLRATAAAPQGQAATPAFAITWPPRRPADDFSDMPHAIQAILNPTRFRGK